MDLHKAFLVIHRSIPIESKIRTSREVHLGKFKLGAELKEKFNNFIQFTSGERPDNQDTKMHMGLYYHASDIWNPSVGDLRIQFSFAGPADSFVSAVFFLEIIPSLLFIL